MRAALFNIIRSRGPFVDDFNRADENLENKSEWTRSGGSAGDFAVRSSQLASFSTVSVGPVYFSPDLGSANHRVEADCRYTTAGGPFVGARITDASNFVGVRYQSVGSVFELYQRVAGTFTLLGTWPPGVSPVGMRIRLDVSGTTADVSINGTLRITALVDASLTSTRTGVLSRAIVTNPFIDNYSAETL